ncbi:MAG TPA: hypothetical protein GX390_02915 [Acholeplasmataceae bacterium]|nr:hypothetical protein [Acholeplasmataceae bacterium]
MNREGSETLKVKCKLNHGDRHYYPGNKIVFTVEIKNDSPVPAQDLLYHQSFPDVITGKDEAGFSVRAEGGRVIQRKGAVIVVFDEIPAHASVRLQITGRIGR